VCSFMYKLIRDLPIWPPLKRILLISSTPEARFTIQRRFKQAFSTRELQISCHWSAWSTKDIPYARIDEADIIVLHGTIPSVLSASDLQILINTGKPIIYDASDVTLPLLASQSAQDQFDFVLRQLHAIVVPSQTLIQTYAPYNRTVLYLNNYIDYNLFYRHIPADNTDAPVKIGIIGNGTTNTTSHIKFALDHLQTRYGQRIVIETMQTQTQSIWSDIPYLHQLQQSHNYHDYAAQLKGLAWDIALIADDSHDASCAWQECAAAGIPCITTHGAVNQTSSDPVALAANSDSDWLQHLATLIESTEQRMQIAHNAQQFVADTYALHQHENHIRTFYCALCAEPLPAKQPIEAMPVQSDDRIPGILIFDPLGNPSKVSTTLTQLNNTSIHTVKIVVLTTSTHNHAHAGSHVQYVTTSPAGFLQMTKILRGHPTFNWIHECTAGNQIIPRDIPSLLFFLYIPDQPFGVDELNA
jgi:hypothetical protein